MYALQILELDLRRSHQLGIRIQAVELLALVHRRHRPGAQLLQAAAREAVRLLRLPHLLVHRRTGARHVLQRVLLRAVDRHVVVAAHARIDKLDIDVVADALRDSGSATSRTG